MNVRWLSRKKQSHGLEGNLAEIQQSNYALSTGRIDRCCWTSVSGRETYVGDIVT